MDNFIKGVIIVSSIILLIIIVLFFYKKFNYSIILFNISILSIIIAFYIKYILNDNKLEKLKTNLDDNYNIITYKIRSFLEIHPF